MLGGPCDYDAEFPPVSAILVRNTRRTSKNAGSSPAVQNGWNGGNSAPSGETLRWSRPLLIKCSKLRENPPFLVDGLKAVS